jgi:hypothetical protein
MSVPANFGPLRILWYLVTGRASIGLHGDIQIPRVPQPPPDARVRRRWWALLLVAGCVRATVATSDDTLASGTRAAACVTHGIADTSTTISTVDPEMRLVAPGTSGTSALLAFTAFGDTTPLVPLASGAIRRQICLKLRAADGCNLIYACWRVGSAKIVVQVKSNPGDHDAGDCGAGGYSTMTPTWAATVPTLADGMPHSITADLDGTALTVSVDATTAWTGAVDPVALTVNGPVGVRSDNERWTGALRADIDCSAANGD